ncbi:MAG: T9SS type A sorting domain-containing protein, partial [Ignavibacteriales bacterium]|nr:T9SS type A sorting domain-containing protein [Ignavibacteriales bacterium]
GKEVAELINEYQNSGTYQITFNAQDLPSGVYFYQLKTGDYISSKKMLLIK